jgi:Transposase DDE domain
VGLHSVEKKQLSARGMLTKIRSTFEQIPEPPRDPRGLKSKIPLADCLMAGLAIFGLKFPSLLQFDQAMDDAPTKHNLKTLYGVKQAPCDTYIRERLDKVDPQLLRPAFTDLFSLIQRGKVIEDYKFLDDCVLVPGDGTGVFSSEEVHCSNCCEKHHKDGRITYYHQMLAGVLVHPDHCEVFPFCPEPISKPDGSTKNDCEQNATRRFLEHFRREHPRLNVIFTFDALSAKAPYIRPIIDMGAHFIIGVNSTGNPSLFEWVKGIKLETLKITAKKEILELSFYNKIPLNDANHDLEVNFIDCVVRDLKGKIKGHFSWITDIEVTKSNVYQLSRGGRARWKIENETFNTLKNQGYNFEHNYGHGKQHLSHVFGILMFLAFLIDQIQQRCCALFQAAVQKAKSRSRFWRRQQSVFTELFIASWEDLFLWMVDRSKGKVAIEDTS